MLKNATLYRLGAVLSGQASDIEPQLSNARFTPCGPTQDKSVGWIEPRGFEHGALLETVDGQWIMKLAVETKDVPGAVIRMHLDAKIKEIQEKEGRKPGRKEQREIKESVRLALLPTAFPKRSVVTVWIEPQKRLLTVDTTSKSLLDGVITFLVASISDLQVANLQTQKSAEAAMAEWLLAGAVDDNFVFYGECELKAADESKAAVKYSRHRLDIEEIQQHVRAGKRPQSLALTWRDRVSFTLATSGQIKKIKLLDVSAEESAGEDDPFDANVKILTGELEVLFEDLITALGGEMIIEL